MAILMGDSSSQVQIPCYSLRRFLSKSFFEKAVFAGFVAFCILFIEFIAAGGKTLSKRLTARAPQKASSLERKTTINTKRGFDYVTFKKRGGENADHYENHISEKKHRPLQYIYGLWER
jgi:hypothetical protein